MRLRLSAILLATAAIVSVAALRASGDNRGHQMKGQQGAGAVYTPSDIRWAAAPNALPQGAQAAVLEGDPTKPGPYTIRLKMPDGYRIAPHSHHQLEHVTVISGNFYVGMGDRFNEAKTQSLAAGGYLLLQPGMHHYAFARGETVIQLHGQGPWTITYLNAADDPRSPQYRHQAR